MQGVADGAKQVAEVEDGDAIQGDSDMHLNERNNEMKVKFESVMGTGNVDVGAVGSDGLVSNH